MVFGAPGKRAKNDEKCYVCAMTVVAFYVIVHCLFSFFLSVDTIPFGQLQTHASVTSGFQHTSK